MNSSSLRTSRPYRSRASSLEAPLHRTPLSIAVAVAAAVACGNSAQAATKTWNNSGTDWNTSANWTGGSPGSSDIAQFNSTFSNQPSLSASTSVGGIWATTGLGQDVTIGGASTLTLAKTTVNSQANTVVYLDVNRDLTFTAPVAFGSGSIITNNSTGTISFGVGTSISGNDAVNGNNASGVVAFNSLTNSGTLTINTSGTVRFVGTNTGGVTLSGGTLDISSGATFAGAVSSAVGTIVTTTAASGTATLTHANNGAVTLNGTVQDGATAALAISKTNNVLTLTGNNTYSGGTTISGATLQIGHNSALGSGSVTTVNTATIQSDSASARTVANAFNLGGNTSFGSTTAGSLSLATVSLGGTSRTFAVANTTSISDLQSGSTTAGAVVLTKGSLTGNTGTGTLNLTGGTFNGRFAINAGTLLVNTDLSAGSGVSTVASGATVGGSGTLGGDWTINGNLSPGNSPGPLAVENNLTINNGSTYLFEGGDLVTVGGTLDLNDNWTLSLGRGLMDGGSVTIFTFAALAASPDLVPTFDIANLGFAPTGSLSLSQVGNSIVLNGVSVAVVPEPSSVMLVLGSAGALLWTGRLRRRIL